MATTVNDRPQLTAVRAVAAWTIFPVVFPASIAAALWAFDRGYHQAIAVTVISGAAAVCLFVLERIQPHTPVWRRSQGDIPTDATHLILSTLLVPAAFEAMFRSLLFVGAAWLATLVGWTMWPGHWHVLGQLALALCVGEFAQYWWHRLAHEHDALWRFHATHHSSGRLYWLNSCRFHPVDSLAQYTLEVGPLLLLGCGGEVIALFTLCTAVIGMFQHANIELRLGPLNWIFSMSELHRWHHSRDTRRGNSNYGANLIVWDVVFGTRYLPADEAHAAEDVGLAGMPNFPQRFIGQMLSPFRWQQLKDESADQSTPNPSLPVERDANSSLDGHRRKVG